MAVYFIQAGEGGPVKIGWATDPGKRLAQLLTGHYDELSLRRVIDGERGTEEWLHQQFGTLHITREWFKYHPDMDVIVIPAGIEEILAARPKEIVDAAREAGNFTVVGARFNISRERVRQIVKRHETETGEKLRRGKPPPCVRINRRVRSAPMNVAAQIIERFGGIRALARILDKPPSTIQHWKKSGFIPARHQHTVLAAAKLAAVGIAAEDFIAEPQPPEAA